MYTFAAQKFSLFCKCADCLLLLLLHYMMTWCKCEHKTRYGCVQVSTAVRRLEGEKAQFNTDNSTAYQHYTVSIQQYNTSVTELQSCEVELATYLKRSLRYSYRIILSTCCSHTCAPRLYWHASLSAHSEVSAIYYDSYRTNEAD
jgi:hypothetical protein